ncbi:hypothetical protein [Caldifermentibacillus hisashii]|uniref:hypothetical protein n=1 Tax=Caldifermentibacillus hisashii TaxID=996558 RepID=UPI0030EA80B4
MGEIIVNGSMPINGMLTVTRTLVETEDQHAIVVEGVLKTEAYIEEIEDIQTELYCAGRPSHQESFGSEEKDIIYAFRA